MLPLNYQPPVLTIECLLFEIVDGMLCIFVGQISGGDHDRQWALPGDFCHQGETTSEALQRIMAEKAGIDTTKLGLLEQLHTFDNPYGDFGQHISIVFLGAAHKIGFSTGYLQANPQFMPVTELPQLAYDQQRAVRYAVQKLRELLSNTTVASTLLPEKFSLTALQQVYELALAKPLDKRNFRKKFLSYDILEDTGKTDAGGAHRPAKLYRFKQPGIRPLQPAQF